MKPRHVPVRTCVGCREEHPKREMVRVVRGADGSVTVDATGRRPGRGAYVCPRPECWTRAVRTGSLNRTLKTEIALADRAELERYAAGLQSDANGRAHPDGSRSEVGPRERGTAYA